MRSLTVLAGGDVRFILVGGAAAIVHGSARLTLDVDVVYERSRHTRLPGSPPLEFRACCSVAGALPAE